MSADFSYNWGPRKWDASPQEVGHIKELIGPNTSQFQATIDTKGLPVGKYDIVVDESLV